MQVVCFTVLKDLIDLHYKLSEFHINSNNHSKLHVFAQFGL